MSNNQIEMDWLLTFLRKVEEERNLGEKGRGSGWKGTEKQVGKNEVDVFFSRHPVFYFPRATITKHHKLSGLNNRNLWSCHSRGWQCVTSGPSEGSVPGLSQSFLVVLWFAAELTLHVAPPCVCVGLCPNSPLLNKMYFY